MAGTSLAVVEPTDAQYLGEDQADRITQERIAEAARSIISRLDGKVRQYITDRRPIEERWMRNLRAYYGNYEPTEERALRDAEQSTAFVHVTRHKTNGWSARISDLLFPTDNKNWGVSPTPIPTLNAKAKEAVAAAQAKIEQANAAQAAAEQSGDPAQAQQAQQLKGEADQLASQVKQHLADIDEAKRRCEWMERTIEDQLIESDYVAECRDVIEDGCKLGTGILKGPTTVQNIGRKWQEEKVTDPSGSVVIDINTGKPKTRWSMQRNADPRPMYKRINPWYFYPDSSASTMREAEDSFEMSLPSVKDLKRSALKLGFNREAVQRLIKQGPPYAPDSVLTHLAELRSLTDENSEVRNRYVMWEYNGPLECDEICDLLRAVGRREDADRFEQDSDPFEEYRVIIHFIGHEVLRIVPDYPLDSGDGLYSVWNFEKSEASVFGYGVPELMKDSQSSLNKAWRYMHDNGALSVGPQIIVEQGAVVPQNGVWGMKPLKFWLRSPTSYATAQVKPFDQFEVSNNQQAYAGMIELAKAFADEESAMPDIAQGEQGASTQTMGGMSILFNSANVVFRRVVKSWDDDLTKPTLRRAYDWNMQFNSDDTIKGDMNVDARGTSVLLVREIQSQNLMAIISNFPNNQALAPYIKVRDTLVKTFQTMMIPPDDVLYTQDEVDKKQAAQAQQPPPEDPRVTAAKLMTDSAQKIAQMREEGAKAIANLRYEAEMAKAEQSSGLTRAELQERARQHDSTIQSTERMKAAEIAVENSREKHGINPGQGIG